VHFGVREDQLVLPITVDLEVKLLEEWGVCTAILLGREVEVLSLGDQLLIDRG